MTDRKSGPGRRESAAGRAIREAAEELRHETRAAASEVRIELGAAGRETGEALREAMAEVRAALGEIWEPEPSAGATAGGGRMSRAQRKEMTRELLLDAAIDVFAEKGYHGASLDDVADAAGFTKGAVYSNFSRKSDLFRALLERETARFSSALTQTVEAVPLELLPDVAAELLAAPESDEQTRTLLVEFWLAAVRDETLQEPLDGMTGPVGAAFEAKLEEAGSDPGLTGEELAVVFHALVTGLLMDRALRPDGAQPQILARVLRKLLAGTDARSAGEAGG
jgi:AcrR family transcriptional regulator